MKKIISFFLLVAFFVVACNKNEDKTGTISGQLKLKSGEVLPFSLVFLKIGENTQQQTTTDDNGKFMFTRIPFGDYNLLSYHESFKTSVPVSVSINSEETLEFDFIFSPVISIQGKVLIGGYPYPSNKIELFDNLKIERIGESYLDLESNFEFYDLAEGVYYIKLTVTQEHLYSIYGYLWNGSSWIWGPFDIESFDQQEVFYPVEIETGTREVVLNINWNGSEFVVNE